MNPCVWFRCEFYKENACTYPFHRCRHRTIECGMHDCKHWYADDCDSMSIDTDVDGYGTDGCPEYEE
jgi:hypothetical protein